MTDNTMTDTPAMEHTRGTDHKKLRLEYVPPEAIDAAATAFMFGAYKYSPHDWRTIDIPHMERYAAALRHMQKWQRGIDYDEEATKHGFKVHHIAAAIAQLSILAADLENKPTLDDRYNATKKD